jgi:hypothetical protein
MRKLREGEQLGMGWWREVKEVIRDMMDRIKQLRDAWADGGHDPNDPHFEEMKEILGMLSFGIGGGEGEPEYGKKVQFKYTKLPRLCEIGEHGGTRMEHKHETMVICGFPGVGKSHIAHWPGVLDLDSSQFRTKQENPSDPLGSRIVYNEDWANDMVLAVQNELRKGENRYVLVSTHKELRNKLREAGIRYVIVAPDNGLRDEYMQRYLRRGSDADFIYKAGREYSNMLICLSFDDAPVIYLKSGQYLSDVLPK